MKVKIFDKIYEVETVVHCEEEKGNYYYLKGKKIPYCDLDYDIEIINESKELNSWEEVKLYLEYVLYDKRGTRAIACTSTSGYLQPFIDDVEKALKDYEMEHTLRIRLENINYELVREKQENSKKLKALEIIKDYQVDIALLLDCQCEEEYLNRVCNRYLAIQEKLGYKRLGKEKFDLLKEVL